MLFRSVLEVDGERRLVPAEAAARVAFTPVFEDAARDTGGGWTALNPTGGYPYITRASHIEVGGAGDRPTGPLFEIDESGTVIRDLAITVYDPNVAANVAVGIQAGDNAEALRTDLNDLTRTTTLNSVTIDNVFVRP